METYFNAWDVTRYGAPEVLRPVSRPMPTPNPTQVLIRIHASAVSRADGMMRAGQPKFARLFLGLKRPRAGLSGTCFSGEIIALGDQVTEFAIGDTVFGEAGLLFGANATHICLDQSGSLLPKPDHLTHQEAATLFDGAMTSWHFLTGVAPVSSGMHVLILGGSGSLGTAAVQFAKALGATVTASASARNGDMLRSLGADCVLDYRTTDPLSARGRYDVVFDTLGVATFDAARSAMTPAGQYVCPVLSFNLLCDMIRTRIRSAQSAKFAAAGMASPELHRQELAEILDLMAKNQFSPVMDGTYPLADLIEAHRYVETGRKRGNVVVV